MWMFHVPWTKIVATEQKNNIKFVIDISNIFKKWSNPHSQCDQLWMDAPTTNILETTRLQECEVYYDISYCSKVTVLFPEMVPFINQEMYIQETHSWLLTA